MVRVFIDVKLKLLIAWQGICLILSMAGALRTSEPEGPVLSPADAWLVASLLRPSQADIEESREDVEASRTTYQHTPDSTWKNEFVGAIRSGRFDLGRDILTQSKSHLDAQDFDKVTSQLELLSQEPESVAEKVNLVDRLTKAHADSNTLVQWAWELWPQTRDPRERFILADLLSRFASADYRKRALRATFRFGIASGQVADAELSRLAMRVAYDLKQAGLPVVAREIYLDVMRRTNHKNFIWVEAMAYQAILLQKAGYPLKARGDLQQLLQSPLEEQCP